MTAWIENLLQTVSLNPFLQALIAALATFVLEDPTTITCGLLIADNQMAYLTAFIGLSSGIIVGDFGLYLLGRFAQPWVMRRKWINPEKINKSRNWFNRNIVLAVMGSRFLPGTRLPTYLTAGILKVSAIKFLTVAVTATVIWTTLLLTLTIHFGKAVITKLDQWKWPAAIAIILLIIVIQWIVRTHHTKKLRNQSESPIKSSLRILASGFVLSSGRILLRLAGPAFSQSDSADRIESLDIFRWNDRRIQSGHP